MRALDYYQSLAKEMKDEDAGRDKMFAAMEQMYHSQWEKPEALKEVDWIRTVISTDPHDAVKAGTRVLSGLQPRIKYCPMAENEASKQEANTRERFAKFWLKGASNRHKAKIVRDVVLSALLYDAVVANVTLLDYQIKIAKHYKMGAAKRLEIAKQYGPFVVSVRNPKDVHVRYSDLMPEAAYCVTQHTLADVLDYWGGAAINVAAKYQDNDPASLYRTMYVHDLTTIGGRTVWASDSPDSGSGIEMMNAETKLPFFPWVARAGGTNLESDSEYQYAPLLASIYHAGQWDTQNTVETLMVSDLIATAAQPKGKATGPNPESVEVDYGEPGGVIRVPAGHDYQQNPPRPMDQALMVISDRFQAAISKSTVARILMSADIPANTAFSSLNLATQTAVGSLKPHKELAEDALADVVALMFRWVAFSKRSMSMMDADKGSTTYGREYVLDAKTIDTKFLDIEVELTPDIPTDRLQRINGASIARRELGYSQESALEDIGVEDPQREIKRGMMEQMVQAQWQTEIQKIQAKAQLELQLLGQQMQMNMQMQAQAQQGMPGYAQNPAMGGMVPAQMNPGATYEGQTGMARNGEGIA